MVSIATLYAASSELVHMFAAGKVGISDLLLFMYLEMLSMLGTYWWMGKLSVRISTYVAMVGFPTPDGRLGLPFAMADDCRRDVDRASGDRPIDRALWPPAPPLRIQRTQR